MGSISTTITLIDNMSGVLSQIEGNVNSLKNTLKSLEDNQSGLDNFSWDGFLQNAQRAGAEMAKIGSEMTLAITLPFTIFGKKLFDSAVNYESAFTGMTKTVKGTADEQERLSEQARIWSEEFSPTSYVDYMGIMQMGGNLGVTIDQMENFSKVYSALQYATDKHIFGESGAQMAEPPLLEQCKAFLNCFPQGGSVQPGRLTQNHSLKIVIEF